MRIGGNTLVSVLYCDRKLQLNSLLTIKYASSKLPLQLREFWWLKCDVLYHVAELSMCITTFLICYIRTYVYVQNECHFTQIAMHSSTFSGYNYILYIYIYIQE